jgi:hypothetical protein
MELNTTGPAKYICLKLSKVMRKVHKYYENKLTAFGINNKIKKPGVRNG